MMSNKTMVNGAVTARRGSAVRLTKWVVPVLAAAILPVLAGCDGNFPSIVSGSGKVETRDFDLSEFTGIRAASAFTVQIDRGETYKVQVTADDNLWNELDISTSQNVLTIRTKPGVTVKNATLSAAVTLPALDSLDLSGAVKATVSPFSSENHFTCAVSGASTLNLEDMKSGTTAFDVSGASTVTGGGTITEVSFVVTGASKVTLAGSGTSATIDASGASSVALARLGLESVSLRLSGASNSSVNTRTITQADLSGASRLSYAGNPAMGNIQTSGGSTIGKE